MQDENTKSQPSFFQKIKRVVGGTAQQVTDKIVDTKNSVTSTATGYAEVKDEENQKSSGDSSSLNSGSANSTTYGTFNW